MLGRTDSIVFPAIRVRDQAGGREKNDTRLLSSCFPKILSGSFWVGCGQVSERMAFAVSFNKYPGSLNLPVQWEAAILPTPHRHCGLAGHMACCAVMQELVS